MGQLVPLFPARREHRLFVELAATPMDVRAAQVLRYQVFGEEMGAKLKGGEPGIDEDDLDPYCHHLLVRESATDRVVGCTRILLDMDDLSPLYSRHFLDRGERF
jgi:putative hemolysin